MARGLDLGIAGRKAIICGSSKGLGRACAAALADAGVEIVVNGRDRERLEHTAAEIAQASGQKVHAVVADVRQAAGREALLAACPEPDILINNAGGPPPGDFRQWTEEQWTEAVSINMLAPIMLIKATIDAMSQKKWGRVVNITSSAVKAPLPTLGLSNGARSGLTGFIAGLAREVAGDGITINNLLPGAFATDRLQGFMEATAKRQGVPFAEVWRQREQSIPAKRMGQPDEFGAACVFLCSQHAGYITGQNILLDGGAYPGVL
jgi:3-oxoacyl-[acyl-carrier protein] reductase